MDKRKTLTPLSEALTKAQPISINIEIPSIKLTTTSFETRELRSIAKAIEDCSAVKNMSTLVETIQKTALKSISPSFDSLRKQLNDSVAAALANYSLALQKAVVPPLQEMGEKMALMYKQQLFQSIDKASFRLSIQENRELLSQEIIDTVPDVEKEEQIPVDDDFYDAVEPIVTLNDTQLDSCPLPEDVVTTVKERPHWMTIERFLAIVGCIIALAGILNSILLWKIDRKSDTAREQRDAERHQEIVECLGDIRDHLQDIDQIVNEQANSVNASPQMEDSALNNDNGNKVTDTK